VKGRDHKFQGAGRNQERRIRFALKESERCLMRRWALASRQERSGKRWDSWGRVRRVITWVPCRKDKWNPLSAGRTRYDWRDGRVLGFIALSFRGMFNTSARGASSLEMRRASRSPGRSRDRIPAVPRSIRAIRWRELPNTPLHGRGRISRSTSPRWHRKCESGYREMLQRHLSRSLSKSPPGRSAGVLRFWFQSLLRNQSRGCSDPELGPESW
jgi:hypothetical protein